MTTTELLTILIPVFTALTGYFCFQYKTSEDHNVLNKVLFGISLLITTMMVLFAIYLWRTSIGTNKGDDGQLTI